jgi:hypothetical protein
MNASDVKSAPSAQDADPRQAYRNDIAVAKEYVDAIDAAPDEPAVRQVLRKLQGDQRVHHKIAHNLNALARARIHALQVSDDRDQGSDENRSVECKPVKVKK